MKAPILAHAASRDTWVPPARMAELKKEIDTHHGSMQFEVYEADHAFVNDTRPEVYAPEAAELALERSFAFLHQHLG
jgi:carboxymethylenebutenolidase